MNNNQGPFTGQWIGGGTALGAKMNYDTPNYGVGGHVVKDFKAPGANIGVEGTLRHQLPSGNTELYVTGSASRNIGPIPKNPNYGVTAGIRHHF